MPSFDQAKAYEPQGDTFFDDGREIELLHFIYSHPKIDEIRGSPQKVLAAIDEYGRTKKYLMNVGEDKGRIVTDLIAEVKPKTMVYGPLQHLTLGIRQLTDVRLNWAAMLATRASSSATRCGKRVANATTA